MYLVQDKYAEAEPLFKRSLAIREKALGKDHPTWRRSLKTWLSYTTIKANTPTPRGSTSARWRSRRRRSAKTIPMWRTRLNNLATLYEAQGKYADAEALFKRALAI